jgi:hypothetical protein
MPGALRNGVSSKIEGYSNIRNLTYAQMLKIFLSGFYRLA